MHTFQAVVIRQFLHQAEILFIPVGMRAIRMEQLMRHSIQRETMERYLSAARQSESAI